MEASLSTTEPDCAQPRVVRLQRHLRASEICVDVFSSCSMMAVKAAVEHWCATAFLQPREQERQLLAHSLQDHLEVLVIDKIEPVHV